MATSVIGLFDDGNAAIAAVYDGTTFVISAINALFAKNPPGGTTLIVTFFDETTLNVLLSFQWPNGATPVIPGGWVFNTTTNRPNGVGVVWNWGQPR